MNIARLIILAVAALAAVAAAFFVRGTMNAEPADAGRQTVERQAPTARVLAARRDIAVGERIAPADIYWQDWPEDALAPNFVTDQTDPEASQRFTGAVARVALAQGEPVNDRKLVQPGDAGFMSAVLSPGMRGVAVPTSARTGAGGFILPNDRVDVIVTGSTQSGVRAETLVENVRVLAIDQTYSETDGETVVGSTATLELTPGQAQAVAQAVAAGDISLALRSVADRAGGPRLSDGEDETVEPVRTETSANNRVVRVFRYGQEQRVALGSGG
ncbi:Flp pilus assembly protein CpaB [Marinicauda salina]|jgi:pilus assembly protein CpaB|uniref:Flp pilus assembly protein CpaB n=1 Tax=Marinicauda salina TaxID=2135793 RepID=A0A2U2BXM6_9PROT|nr:Flp pilus assembly protein CpaB [Marinicauda salina]PWE18765.1 Flp pilus assembly protein CpaB [Marinicauda salina]